jgi:predicted transcriptional regulator
MPKAKQAPVPYGFLRKNGQLIVDPTKKEVVQKLYGKFVENPELILEIQKLIAEMVRDERSKVAKLAYQRRLIRLQQGER